MTHVRHPALRTGTRIEATRTSGFETQQGLCPEDLKDCREPRFCSSRACTDSPQDPAQRQQSEKCLDRIVKETHLLVIKHLPERQGHVGTLLEDRDAAGHHFCTLPLPCACQWDMQPQLCSAALLKLVGMPHPCVFQPIGRPQLSHCLTRSCWHAQSTQGTALEHLPLWPGGSEFLGLMELKQRGSSWQVTLPGQRQDTRLKHTPSHPIQRPVYLSWSFSLRGKL